MIFLTQRRPTKTSDTESLDALPVDTAQTKLTAPSSDIITDDTVAPLAAGPEPLETCYDLLCNADDFKVRMKYLPFVVLRTTPRNSREFSLISVLEPISKPPLFENIRSEFALLYIKDCHPNRCASVSGSVSRMF